MSKLSLRVPNLKQWLFILWFICAYGWMIFMGSATELRAAINTYSMHNHYANKIVAGHASPYERKLYLNYGDRLRTADKRVAVFLFFGLGFPGLVLAGGTWLMRSAKPKKNK